jgi:ArsR family transcriptional regulator
MVHHKRDNSVDSECCDIFKALSVETRVKIIQLLKAKGPLGAKKIAELVGVTPAAISQHLRMLKHVGLVRSERKGYWIPYEIDTEAMEGCRFKLSEICSCECGPPHKVVVRPMPEDSLESLERYRRDLEKELERVNRRIAELDRRKKI